MKPTQRQQVLTALQAGRRLTPDDAIKEFRCYRLAARIHDLRKAGVQIECDESKGYGIYWLAEKEKQCGVSEDRIEQARKGNA